MFWIFFKYYVVDKTYFIIVSLESKFEWMKEEIILSKVSETLNDKYCIVLLI